MNRQRPANIQARKFSRDKTKTLKQLPTDWAFPSETPNCTTRASHNNANPDAHMTPDTHMTPNAHTHITLTPTRRPINPHDAR